MQNASSHPAASRTALIGTSSSPGRRTQPCPPPGTRRTLAAARGPAGSAHKCQLTPFGDALGCALHPKAAGCFAGSAAAVVHHRIGLLAAHGAAGRAGIGRIWAPCSDRKRRRRRPAEMNVPPSYQVQSPASRAWGPPPASSPSSPLCSANDSHRVMWRSRGEISDTELCETTRTDPVSD